MKTVEEILESNNIYYKNQGKDYVVSCFNPEHDDSSPSMKIDKISGVFGCFSCGHSGNIFYEYNEVRNEAKVQILEAKAKIRALLRTSIYIPLGAEPFDEEYRDISPATYKHFEAFTFQGELCGKTVDDRLVVPIRDINDIVQFFIARYIHSHLSPKYLVTPSNSVKGLWPAVITPRNNSICLVEGTFDVMNLYDKGLANAVCSFGTSFGLAKKRETVEHNMAMLDPYSMQGVTTIFILYDSDDSGKLAGERLERNIPSKFKVEVITLPIDLDPGKMSQEEVTKLINIIDNY